MPKHISKKQGSPQVRAIMIGSGLTVGLILVFSMAGSMMILNGWLPENASGMVAAAAVFIAAFLGPMPLMKSVGKRALPVAYGHMVLLLVLMMLCKLIFWPAAPYGNWAALAAAPAGATAAGLVRTRKPKRHR